MVGSPTADMLIVLMLAYSLLLSRSGSSHAGISLSEAVVYLWTSENERSVYFWRRRSSFGMPSAFRRRLSRLFRTPFKNCAYQYWACSCKGQL